MSGFYIIAAFFLGIVTIANIREHQFKTDFGLVIYTVTQLIYFLLLFMAGQLL